MAGLSPDEAGRAAFHEEVISRIALPRDGRLSGTRLHNARATLRADLRVPVEVTSPLLATHSEVARLEVLFPAAPAPRPAWRGPLSELLEAVCAARGIALEELRSPSQRRPISSARRLFVSVGHIYLRRPLTELAAALGVAVSTASRLHGRCECVATGEAEALAAAVRG